MMGAASSEEKNSSPHERNTVFDVLRGVVMIGVVLSHVMVGVADAGLSPVGLGRVNSALYLVHMPIFALLAGLTLADSSEKRSRWPHFLDRIGTFVYLYVIWTMIQGAVEVGTNGVRNNRTSFEDVISLWTPIAHLWFLTWLAVATCLALLVRPWRRSVWVAPAMVAVAAWSISAWGVEGTSIPERGMALTIFLLIGALLTRRRFERWLTRLSGSAAAFGSVILLSVYAFVAVTGDFSAPTTPAATPDGLSVLLGIVGTLTGSGALIGLMVLLDRAGLPMRLLQVIGRNSLSIFLMHLIFIAGTRVGLSRLGILEPVTHLAVGTVIGVVIPLLLARLVMRSALLSWMVNAPWPSVPKIRL